jgi:hypothetical protein
VDEKLDLAPTMDHIRSSNNIFWLPVSAWAIDVVWAYSPLWVDWNTEQEVVQALHTAIYDQVFLYE